MGHTVTPHRGTHRGASWDSPSRDSSWDFVGLAFAGLIVGLRGTPLRLRGTHRGTPLHLRGTSWDSSSPSRDIVGLLYAGHRGTSLRGTSWDFPSRDIMDLSSRDIVGLLFAGLRRDPRDFVVLRWPLPWEPHPLFAMGYAMRASGWSPLNVSYRSPYHFSEHWPLSDPSWRGASSGVVSSRWTSFA